MKLIFILLIYIFSIEEEPFKQSEKDEIKESLHTHRNLLNFDSNNLLILQAAHREIKSNKTIRVKGHTLDERTMRITVPAINIGIYVNPLFAIFTKPSIAIMSIHRDGLTEGKNEIMSEKKNGSILYFNIVNFD